jgi:hypothetical protein
MQMQPTWFRLLQELAALDTVENGMERRQVVIDYLEEVKVHDEQSAAVFVTVSYLHEAQVIPLPVCAFRVLEGGTEVCACLSRCCKTLPIRLVA